MNHPRRFLFLMGSLKRDASSSAALAEYLAEHVRVLGAVTETCWLADVADGVLSWHACLDAVSRADEVVLAFPVYADGPPAIVVAACEQIAGAPRPGTRLAVVTCAGNPEAAHCAIAIAQARRFADACGWQWAGALAMGQGDTIAGRALGSLGWLQRHTRTALVLAATALAAGGSVPERARALMARPVLPPWLYPAYAWVGLRRMARRRGGPRTLDAQPYHHLDA